MESVLLFQEFIMNNSCLLLELQGAINQVPERVPSIDFLEGDRPGIMHNCSV
jgi:hypothetical protein